MAGAAEQQAPVRREPVVIQRHSLVADRHVLRQQGVGLCFAQGFGGDDVAAGGQHFAAEFRIEVVEVGIAAQHQRLGAHRTLSGVDLNLGAVIDAGDRRLFEQFARPIAVRQRLRPSARFSGCRCPEPMSIKPPT